MSHIRDVVKRTPPPDGLTRAEVLEARERDRVEYREKRK